MAAVDSETEINNMANTGVGDPGFARLIVNTKVMVVTSSWIFFSAKID